MILDTRAEIEKLFGSRVPKAPSPEPKQQRRKSPVTTKAYNPPPPPKKTKEEMAVDMLDKEGGAFVSLVWWILIVHETSVLLDLTNAAGTFSIRQFNPAGRIKQHKLRQYYAICRQ